MKTQQAMSKKIKLTDREWREFKIKDLFSIRIGDSLDGNKVDRTGLVAYVTRKESSNGVDGFISNDIERMWSDVPAITIGNETAKPFVQRYPFFTGTKVNILSPKIKCSYYALMFISVSLEQHKSKYSYSYTINSTRLKEQVILLPVQVDSIPDWAFMEAYMKQVEDELLSEVLPKLEAQLLEHIITLGALDDREWRAFQFKDVFYIVDGYYNKKPSMEENGTLPFLGATQYNNGVTGMTSRDNVRLRDKVGGNSMNDVEKRFYAGGCIAITNNGSVGHAYYQSSEFTCSHDITVIYLKDQVMSKELATFLIPSIQKAGESFAYAKKWRPIRMRRSKLMLPIQADGTPDWEFMSAFMKKVEQETLSGALRYFRPKKYKQMLTRGG